jgi:parallel beta-helix repeat protein
MRRFTLLSLLAGLCLGALLPATAGARTFNVHQGQSIQRAVDRANPGDRIYVRPGTYHERGVRCPSEPQNTCAVAIQDDSISLIGRPKKNRPVIVENAGDQAQGVAVGRSDDPSCLEDADQRVDGSLIQNIEVNGFSDDGIFLSCVDNWRVTGVSTTDDAEYGIFPSHVGAGRVDNSFASGANDTGIYIGQSHDVEIDHNVATANVSGFEIENSTRVHAHDNESFGNTGGLLSFTLPFLDVKANEDNEVENNYIHDNDKPNTCLDPEDAVCGVPRGTGILILAADTNAVHDNRVVDNDTFGIAVSNICAGQNLPPEVCAVLDIDPDPDGNHIVSNVVGGNGANPDPIVPSIFAVDLAWDLSGDGNCWQDNTSGGPFPPSSFPPSLPSCP